MIVSAVIWPNEVKLRIEEGQALNPGVPRVCDMI